MTLGLLRLGSHPLDTYLNAIHDFEGLIICLAVAGQIDSYQTIRHSQCAGLHPRSGDYERNERLEGRLGKARKRPAHFRITDDERPCVLPVYAPMPRETQFGKA
jgi:hypothetical protein